MEDQALLIGPRQQMRPRASCPNTDIFPGMGLATQWHQRFLVITGSLGVHRRQILAASIRGTAINRVSVSFIPQVGKTQAVGITERGIRHIV